jgi:hypothetical protein
MYNARCTHEIKSRIAVEKKQSTRRRRFSPENWTNIERRFDILLTVYERKN